MRTIPNAGGRFAALSTCLLAALVVTTSAAPARAADTKTPIADGVTMLTRTTSNPWIIHVLEAHLDAPGVHLGATTSAQRQRTTSSFAKLVGAAAATNGDLFSYATYATSGLAAGGGARWTDTSDNATSANLAFDDGSRVEIHPAPQILAFDPTWMKGVVSGHPTLLKAGVALTSNASGPACSTRNPRTAVGLSQDKKTLFLVVVDGRSTASIGMLCTEEATLLAGLGAYDAFNMDGGGSTTMYVRGTGVVNHPSDGTERVVGNHLAIFAPHLGSVGSVKGEIYEDPDPGKPITGASVSITKGGTDTTDAAGSYELDTLPGTFTVTAKKPGFTAKTTTVTIGTGADVKLDVGLVRDPNADFDGDGVPDAKDDCPEVANPDQLDTDHDGMGDACDMDDDNDGKADEDDDCPLVADPDQTDSNHDGVGDACTPVPGMDGGAPATGDGVQPDGAAPDASGGCDVAGAGQRGRRGRSDAPYVFFAALCAAAALSRTRSRASMRAFKAAWRRHTRKSQPMRMTHKTQ